MADRNLQDLYNAQLCISKTQVKISNLEKKPIFYHICTFRKDVCLSSITVAVILNDIDLAISKIDVKHATAVTIKNIINDHIKFGHYATYCVGGITIKLVDVKHVD